MLRVLERLINRSDTPITRFIVAGLVAALAAAWLWLLPNTFPNEFKLLVVWLAYSLTFLLLAWLVILTTDAAETYASATRQDDARTLGRWLLILPSVASLAVTLLALLRANALKHTPAESQLTVAAILSVITAWGVLHTAYTLHYAYLYHQDGKGGVKFDGSDKPVYSDFAYLSFTVGMTYQISDTDLQSPAFRRAVLGHELLSYMFGTAVIALSINVLSNLLQ